MAHPASDLAQALDAMHRAILAFDLPELAVLSAQIEDLLADPAPVPDAAAKAALQKQASRNAACLLAAARGFRAARRRLVEVAAAGSGLATYDASGKRADVPTPADRLRLRF